MACLFARAQSADPEEKAQQTTDHKKDKEQEEEKGYLAVVCLFVCSLSANKTTKQTDSWEAAKLLHLYVGEN